MLIACLGEHVSQEQFAGLIGVSRERVTAMVGEGILARDGTAAQWLLAYCARLRATASGRVGDGDLDLAQERAALAREQRLGQAIKNATAQGQFADVGLLGDVLASASAAIVDRLDALPGLLRKVCPDLPAAAREAIERTIASARNEWVKGAADLVVRRLDELGEDEPAPETADEEAPE